MDETRTCINCERALPFSNFYRSPGGKDGLSVRCKECVKAGVRENRSANRERYSDYERRRSKLPARKEQQRLQLKNRRQRGDEKTKARDAVSNALRDGKLEKEPCKDCGDPEVQGHHEDYDRPLDVTWLCFRCHRARHGQVVVSF